MSTSARMSSTSAAPMTTFAQRRSSTPMSRRTRLVMPMLVAASARPTKNDASASAPSASPIATPAMIGRTMPMIGGEDRRPADAEQVVRAHLEADGEQEDDDADLGEHERRLAGRHESQGVRADEEPAEQLADDARAAPAGGGPPRRSSRRAGG